MPDWRDEVCSALDFCIGAEGGAGQSERLVCIGPARQESRRGWYSVDLRDSSCYNSACPGISANGRKAWTKSAAGKRIAQAPS